MKRSILSVVALSISAVAMQAQDLVTVRGTVLSKADEEPLIGATIVSESSKEGAVTDIDGMFTIQVPEGSNIKVTYVGYNPVTLKAAPDMTIELSENQELLDEVVVVGYQTVRKADLTGAVSVVSTKALETTADTDPMRALQGSVPGMTITADGSPAGTGSVRIRGIGSFNASQDPLFVIDGVPTTASLNSLNMNDIESMQVLKDAASASIYGSRAANGVIIITTKKGSRGKPEVTFSANMYINTPRNYVNMMDGDEFRQFITDRYGVGSTQYNALGTANTDWQKGILETSISSDYNLSVGGTYKALPYRVSASWTGNNGIIKSTKMDRATVGINLSPKFFDDLLTVNANVRGAWINNRYDDRAALSGAIGFNPTLPVMNPEGNVFNGYTTYVGTDPAGPGAAGNAINRIAALNPIAMNKEYDSQSYVLQSIGNLQLDLAMPFLRDLHANLNLGYEVSRSNVRNITFSNSPMAWKNGSDRLIDGEIKNVQDGVGRYTRQHQVKVNTLLDFYLNYRKDVESIHSGFDVTAGYSYQRFRWQGYEFSRTYEAEPFQAYPAGRYRNDLVLVSFFGRLNYTFMNRYLLTVTVRQDGTSRFSKDNRWGTFPSAALGWKILDEAFMEGARGWLSELKLRAGYGVTGQQDLNDDYFPYLPIYTVGNNGNPGTNQWAYPNPLGPGYINPIKPNGYNSSIKWEETHTWNAGIDFGFLNNRINGSVDFYKRNTKDLLTWATLPAGSNLTNALNTNIGDMENIGVEFNITARPVVTKDFTWTTGLNVAWNKNKITKLTYGDNPDYFMAAGEGISAGTGGTIMAHTVGKPAYSFYVYRQVYDVNGDPIEGQFVDRNGDGQITEADKYFYHSKDPKVTLTWSNTLNYKNWDLGFVLRSNIGNYVYNNVEAANTSIAVTASTPLSNLMADRYLFNDLGVKGVMSDYFVRNASFVRCDNITLGYTWPSLLKNQLRLRLYGAVQNPFVITKYNGLDPEIFSGVDKEIYPRPLTVSFGVVASF